VYRKNTKKFYVCSPYPFYQNFVSLRPIAVNTELLKKGKSALARNALGLYFYHEVDWRGFSNLKEFNILKPSNVLEPSKN